MRAGLSADIPVQRASSSWIEVHCLVSENFPSTSAEFLSVIQPFLALLVSCGLYAVLPDDGRSCWLSFRVIRLLRND